MFGKEMGSIFLLFLCLIVILLLSECKQGSKAALTKEQVDTLLATISGPCQQQMENALDMQAELQPQCKEEIQEALLQIPGIDPREGTVDKDATDLQKPPNYDQNLKPPLPPKPRKLEREMRRVQREKKREEDDKLWFATQVGVFLVVASIIVYCVMRKEPISSSFGSQKKSPDSAKKVSNEDWMDEPPSKSNQKNDKGSNKDKKKRH